MSKESSMARPSTAVFAMWLGAIAWQEYESGNMAGLGGIEQLFYILSQSATSCVQRQVCHARNSTNLGRKSAQVWGGGHNRKGLLSATMEIQIFYSALFSNLRTTITLDLFLALETFHATVTAI
ncbi:uncharacterized protein TrAtP1_002731 [Trichoderma atroviride]|uniref:uncharacterized protein n=1 Tax=Hypocrea atroviridis TaxID=63577 RepID=UPI00332C35C8|nr:hypothetical protein TrAtP1_002731 [Trichoderma atroviride]